MLREEVVQFTEELEVAARPGARTVRARRPAPFALVAGDAALIYAALAIAYWARYSLTLGPRVSDSTPFSGYQLLAGILVITMLFVLGLKGAYRPRLGTEPANEIVTIVSAATITVASILVVTFMLHQFAYSRAVIIYLWGLLILLLAAGRALQRVFQSQRHRRGLGVRRLLVVGSSDAAKMIMQSVVNRPDLGYEVVGFVDHSSTRQTPDFGRFHALGTTEDIPGLIETEHVDDVILALPASAHEHVPTIVELCERYGVGLKLVPDLFEVKLSRVRVDDIAGIPLLDVQEPAILRVDRAVKRAIDIVLATVLLLLSLPVLGLLAVLIRLDSVGPVFIRQERVGYNARRFACFKLRSMHTDAHELLPALQALNEATGPIFKMRNDPRCTRVGRHLRRFSLDELPQLWNVLRGDMSLVGPRPPLWAEVERYEDWQMRRLETKPGITGLWQVSGRSNLAFDEMVMMDIMYVDNWSLALDLKILMRTFTAVLGARGAY